MKYAVYYQFSMDKAWGGVMLHKNCKNVFKYNMHFEFSQSSCSVYGVKNQYLCHAIIKCCDGGSRCISFIPKAAEAALSCVSTAVGNGAAIMAPGLAPNC